MTTVIQELGELVKQIRGARVDCRTAEMLVTLPMGEGREQTVKVLSQRGVRGPYAVLRMISRACVARDHGIVTRALRANGGNEWGGLALDISTDPPAIDVVYNLIGDDLSANDFLAALHRVASLADRIEQRIEASDEF